MHTARRWPRWITLARTLPPASWWTLAACAGLILYALGAAYFLWVQLADLPRMPPGSLNTPSVTLAFLAILTLGHEARALAWSQVLSSTVAVPACALAAWIMVRSYQAAASRQMAGLLLAAAAMLLLRLAPLVTSVAHAPWMADADAWFVLDTATTLYLALGLARFLIVFPRAVDVDSVERTYLAGRPLTSWLGRIGPPVPFRLLRAWHRYLVNGRLLLLAPGLPLLVWAASLIAHEVMPRDIWGFFVGLAAVVAIGVYLGFGLPFALASTAHLRRFGTDDERERVSALRAVLLGLLLLGALALLAMPVLSMFDPPPSGTGMPIAVPTVSAAVRVMVAIMLFFGFLPAIAAILVAATVLRRRALDARLTFSRMTLWSVLGLAATLGFVLFERFLTVRISGWLGLGPDMGSVFAGVVVTGTVMPLRHLAAQAMEKLSLRLIPLHELAQGERRVQAVALVDLSGYTALSARDEQTAILQSAALSRLAGSAAGERGGRRVKGLGDAVLLAFDDAAQAAAAVLEIHRRYPAAVQPLGLDPLALHSALHVGEVVQAIDGDVFGQPVNVTARLLPLAGAGQVVISQAVLGTLPAGTAAFALGPQRLKNVPEPVDCFLLEAPIDSLRNV